MLRVRPLISTTDLPRAAAFLRALGLSPAEGPALTNSAMFDAGSGRVGLCSCASGSPEQGSTSLAFDVGDVREFARRTVESGTPAEILGEGPGTTAKIPAPDGMSFSAELGPRDTGAPASSLTVVARWHTPDPASAARVLEDIGAKPRNTPGARYAYRAKNGGVVEVLAADRTVVELAFDYDGDVRELLGNLTDAGAEPVVLQDGPVRSLRVTAPWGARLLVEEKLPDVTGVATG
jgi:hypothetical protein